MGIIQGIRIIDARDPAAGQFYRGHHPVMDVLEIGCRHHLLSDPALVGDHDDMPEDGRTAPQGLWHTFVKNEFPVVEDVTAFLLYIDDPVTVQEERPVIVDMFEWDHQVGLLSVSL